MVLKGLNTVRKVYKIWRALPPDERAKHASEIRRIRVLVKEVGGSRGLRYVEGADIAGVPDDKLQQPPEPQRSRTAALEELQEASSSMVVALAAPASSLAVDALPRSLRFGGQLAGRRVARYVERARGSAAPKERRATTSPAGGGDVVPKLVVDRPLPDDLVERLEPFGRFEYKPQGSGVDAVGHPNAEYPLLQLAKRDPDGFLTALAASTIPVGEWTVYGAMRLIWHFGLLKADESCPRADAIGLAALTFLRDRGDSWDHLRLDEKALWSRVAARAW